MIEFQERYCGGPGFSVEPLSVLLNNERNYKGYSVRWEKAKKK